MTAAKKTPAKKPAKKAAKKAGPRANHNENTCRRFAEAWLMYGNNALAYRQALPHNKANNDTARREGFALYHDPRTQAWIDKTRAAACRRAEATLAEWISNELRLTRFDPARLLDEDGNVLPLANMDPDTRFAIQHIEVEEEKIETTRLGDDTEVVRRTRVKKIRVHSKDGAQDRLGKHLGAFLRDNEQKSATYEEVLKALHGQPDIG